MTSYESSVKILNCSVEHAYEQLSDLRNLEQFKERIPSDKLQDLEFTADTCHFSVSPVGRVGIKIVDREPLKTIKFGGDNTPLPFNIWIQLLPKEDGSKMKITLRADLPLMIKTMVGGKLQGAVDQMAEVIAQAFNR